VKGKHIALIIAAIIIADQTLKFFVKLNYFYGDPHFVIGKWFQLELIENPGMAYGWEFGGNWGKIFLTLFRLVAVIWGVFLLKDFIRKKYHKGFIICASLIFSGALGNLIDSMFYGLIFDRSTHFDPVYNGYGGYDGIAQLTTKGYGTFFHGSVVDMLHFPLFHGTFPSWFPFWGGEGFEFFSPVFNIADASISVGVFILLIFQNKFFKNVQEQKPVAANS
jgi:signal peptidase II